MSTVPCATYVRTSGEILSELHYTVFRDSHDRWGRPVTSTWQALAQRLDRHEEGEKDGLALCCASFRRDVLPGHGIRGNANLLSRSLIALDIETSRDTGEVPPPLDAVADFLAVRRLSAVLWTTHSHTEAEPRYRVVMPLGGAFPLPDDVDPFLPAIVAAQCELTGVADRSKFGASSLFYLPRHRPGAPFASRIVEGNPIDLPDLVAVAIMTADMEAQDEAMRAALRRTYELPPELAEAIEAFNDAHPLPQMLERYGYQRQRARWKSRYQHGQGATTILPDGRTWVTFSESDAAAGVGTRPAKRTSQCAAWGTAFDLLKHFEYRGNFRAALAAIRESGNGHQDRTGDS